MRPYSFSAEPNSCFIFNTSSYFVYAFLALCAFSETFIWYPPAFIADFGLGKGSFSSWKFFFGTRRHFRKMDYWFPVTGKYSFRVCAFWHWESVEKLTRRERLKWALYLRLKKRKRLFLKKKLEIFDFFSFRNRRIVPKNVKGGTLWALLTYILLQNMKKLEGGPFWDIKNFFEKEVAQCRKKSKGGTF